MTHAADILDQMTSQTRARLQGSVALGGGVVAALWRNGADEAATLLHPREHVLSLYVDGGERTRRLDAPSRFGAPGLSCFLPSGHSSVWEVPGEMRFLHLYFDRAQFAAQAALAWDADVRDVAGREMVYFDDPAVRTAMSAISASDWSDPADRLRISAFAERLAQENAPRWFDLRRRRVARGGLTPQQRRRVLEMIEARLAEPIALADLALEIGRSSWHVAKIFRDSVGVSPAAYVHERRMLRARRMLAETDASVGDVAAACGHRSPTRFAGAVKARFGAPPSALRAALRPV